MFAFRCSISHDGHHLYLFYNPKKKSFPINSESLFGPKYLGPPLLVCDHENVNPKSPHCPSFTAVEYRTQHTIFGRACFLISNTIRPISLNYETIQ